MLRCKWLVALAVPFLLTLPLRAQEAPPAAVVRVRSIDAALEAARTLAKLALDGNEAAANELFKKFEGELKSKVGIKAVEGIDRSRPFGAYVRFGKEVDDISGAVLIPVDDEKKFLAFLEAFPVTVQAFAGGVYTIQTPTPVELYLKFANKYAYVTAMNKNALDNLVDPAKVLGTAKDGPLAAASFRIDQVPETARQIALAGFEDKLQQNSAKENPNETPASKEARLAVEREGARAFKALLNEGQELSIKLDLNPTTKMLHLESNLSGKADSDMSKWIRSLADTKSVFGGLGAKDSAVRGSLNFALPETIRKAFNKIIDEAMTKSLDSISDADKKKQAQELFDALNPTLKSGQLDIFASLVGPGADKKYVVLAGTKVEKGAELHKTLLRLLDDLLTQVPDQVKALIKLNVDEAAGIKIHRFDIPAMGNDSEKLERIVGSLRLSIAIGPDAAMVALGTGGQDALKEALKSRAAKAASVGALEVNIGRLFSGIEMDMPEAAREKITQVAKEAGNPPVTLSIEGGAALRAVADIPFAVIQAMAPRAKKQ